MDYYYYFFFLNIGLNNNNYSNVLLAFFLSCNYFIVKF